MHIFPGSRGCAYTRVRLYMFNPNSNRFALVFFIANAPTTCNSVPAPAACVPGTATAGCTQCGTALPTSGKGTGLPANAVASAAIIASSTDPVTTCQIITVTCPAGSGLLQITTTAKYNKQLALINNVFECNVAGKGYQCSVANGCAYGYQSDYRFHLL